MGTNAWLENTAFLDKVDFNDKVYFQILAKYVSDYLKNVPIPLKTWWVSESKRIYFLLGQNIKWYASVNTFISFRDYITKVEKFARKHYPQYVVVTDGKRNLSEQEILVKMKQEGISFDEALQRTEPIKSIEFGIIEKVFFKQDKFILTIIKDYDKRKLPEGIIQKGDEINYHYKEESYLMQSGIPAQKPLAVSEFLNKLKEFNQLPHDEKGPIIKEYIFDNSISLKQIGSRRREEISYEGMEMINFFDINFYALKYYPLVQISPNIFTWKNFDIFFTNDNLKQECLNLYNTKLEDAKKNVSN